MTEAGLRADKWLWYARFFKSRSLAAKLCVSGQLRIAGQPVSKAHHLLRVGDVLTFPQGRHIRVVRIRALGSRRGPASEASELYEDLKPPTPDNRLPIQGRGPRPEAGGRPTKKARRELERLRRDL
jgi:ribosome-associated heat shock protein Hsp15